MRITSITLGCLLALPLLAAPAAANWLGKVIAAAEHAGSRLARHGPGSLDGVAAHVRALPVRPGGSALAAAATPEGHWRFVNRAGETMTVASPEEMRRALSILAPDAGAAEPKLALYLTEDTVLRHRAALRDLPATADLHVLLGKAAYPLVRRPGAAGEPLLAQVRPHLLVEMGEPRLVHEALFQLARPLDKASIRVIALEPGGPGLLAPVPRIDAGSGRALTDAIDPDRLRHALGQIRGQTALLTGRVDGELLYFKPASGPERSLLLRDLTAAAEAADVNLVILKSAAPRQPGARNWLWQRAEVKGLDAALQRASLGDFLDALVGGAGGRMTVSATPQGALRTTPQGALRTTPQGALRTTPQGALRTTPQGALRTTLDVRPAPELGSAPVTAPITDALADIVSDLAGRVVTSGIEANLPSAERQRELDSRFVPGVPSWVQYGYLGLVVLGLFGLVVARAWWRRLWPAEQRLEYASAFGYHAARLVRAVVFLLAFVPLVAIASAPVQAVQSLWGMLLAACRVLVLLWRILTWPLLRLFGARAGQLPLSPRAGRGSG